jgi:type II secretory pathway component PulF
MNSFANKTSGEDRPASPLHTGTPTPAPAKKPAALKARTLKAPAAKSPKIRQFNKKQLIALFRGLSSMLRAQINTADALKYYVHGLPDKPMVDALLKVRDDINAGINVHEAFRRTGRFNETVIGLIQAGSDAGQLHQAFRSLAARMTTEMHFQKQIRKATVTPGVIICVLFGAFIVSQVKIVPQVEEMLSGVGAEPDGLTAISFMISHFIQGIWPVLVLGLIATGVTIGKSKKVQNVLLGLAMSKWRLLRLLTMSLRQMTLLATIRLLHSNGINLAKSIRVAANSVRNTPFYDELRAAADKYEHSGVPLSTAFGKYTSVDDQITHMLAIGEKSASLDNQLEMLAVMYEEDAENHMSAFASTVSFIVLLIAVGLVAAVFVGTFLPIFLIGPKMMNNGM